MGEVIGMCWFCGTCRVPSDTPFDPNAKLVIRYGKPKKFVVPKPKGVTVTRDSLDTVVRSIRDRVSYYPKREGNR